MSSKRITSEHPDLDEIVEVSVDDDLYKARIQVSLESLNDNLPAISELEKRLGKKLRLKIVFLDDRETANLNYLVFDSEVMRTCLDFIADHFLTYDDSMQEALRNIDLGES